MTRNCVAWILLGFHLYRQDCRAWKYCSKVGITVRNSVIQDQHFILESGALCAYNFFMSWQLQKADSTALFRAWGAIKCIRPVGVYAQVWKPEGIAKLGSAMPVTWSDSYDGSTCFSICCCLGLHSWVGSYVIPKLMIIVFMCKQSFESIETLLSRWKQRVLWLVAQVFAGKRVPTTGRQYCKRKPKTKNQKPNYYISKT